MSIRLFKVTADLNSLVAEARALKDRVSLALRAGYTKINIEGKNLVVIQALKGINRVRPVSSGGRVKYGSDVYGFG